MRHVCPECGEAGDAGLCAKDKIARAPVGMDALLGEQIGSWRIARLIGAGGMGRVYLGVQPSIGAHVAIKVLKEATDKDTVERFFNEARAVNVIRHEGIVDVIDLGRLPSGAPYIVMEHLPGVPLRVLIKREPRPHAGALANVLVHALAALDAAHAAGIIHRDLKPDNIFVSPGGRVTVLDFGIAKLANEVATQTKTGNLLGTPAYMSAEQARSQPVDARSDLYSVGVILYEAATGMLPFSAPSLYDLLDQHVKATPRPPREIDPAIPEALEAVILRALAKDPADRFQSAREMRAALEAALEPLPKSELQLPAIETPVHGPTTADPHAATAATHDSLAPSTNSSIAYAETRASADVPPAARAHPDTGVRVSRGLLGVIAGASLLSLAAVAYVVLRDRTPAALVRRDAALLVVVPDAAVDAQPIDAPPDAPPDATPDAAIDAPVDAAPKKVAAPAPPPDLHNGPVEIKAPNPSRFDPVAYYKTALAKAEWIAGGKVRPYKVTWRQFDRSGRIDLTAGGSAVYDFAMQTPKDEFCLVVIIFEENKGSLGIASTSSNCSGGIMTPRCTIAQLWERATAAGMPDTAKLATANLNGRWWAVSSPGVDGGFDFKNDCE